jgi:hypothetical protein
MIRNLGLDPHASGVVTVDGRAYTAHTGQQRVGGGLPQAWVVHTPRSDDQVWPDRVSSALVSGTPCAR